MTCVDFAGRFTSHQFKRLRDKTLRYLVEILKLKTKLCRVYFLKIRDFKKYNELKDLHLNLQENEMYNGLKDLYQLFKTKTNKKVSICDELIGEIEFFTN